MVMAPQSWSCTEPLAKQVFAGGEEGQTEHMVGGGQGHKVKLDFPSDCMLAEQHLIIT